MATLGENGGCIIPTPIPPGGGPQPTPPRSPSPDDVQQIIQRLSELGDDLQALKEELRESIRSEKLPTKGTGAKAKAIQQRLQKASHLLDKMQRIREDLEALANNPALSSQKKAALQGLSSKIKAIYNYLNEGYQATANDPSKAQFLKTRLEAAVADLKDLQRSL